jgi:hypothetical protein
MYVTFPPPLLGPSPPERVELEEVWIVHRTARAVLIQHQGDRFWIPLSQVENSWVYEVGYLYEEMRVSEWFALKAQLI